MYIPNELVITIFNFIKKITDKRQFLKTCKLHNTLLKELITEMGESELDYFRTNCNNVDYFEKKLYYYIYLQKRDHCAERFMIELCYDSYFNMIPLSYLAKNINNTVIIKLLIKYGKLELLQLAMVRKPTKLRLCELAAESGQLNILKWLVEKKYNHNYDWYIIICAIAATNGHLNILIWAKENGYIWNNKICEHAAINNHLDILKWARANGCEWDKYTIEVAIKNRSWDVLKWARENSCPE